MLRKLYLVVQKKWERRVRSRAACAAGGAGLTSHTFLLDNLVLKDNVWRTPFLVFAAVERG